MQQNSKLTNERLAQVYQSLKRWADHDDALNSYISGQKIDPIFHDCVVALAELQEYRKAAAESAESAESAGWQAKRPGGNWVSIKNEDIDHYRFNEEVPVREVFTAPPAPISVPAAMEMDDDFDSSFEHGKAVGWNACRAAMLQGADGTLIGEGTITATQFKPVADLYGLTSPTGGETSFTFDAVEARDFIDGGWSCQDYVELERFQEAVSGNSPVIPDGWVVCSERMPEQFKAILAFNEYGEVWSGAYDRYWNFYCDNLLVEHVTHWMPLPAAPQQEA